jgi:hypothetical protein
MNRKIVPKENNPVEKGVKFLILINYLYLLKAMLHSAIFLATCNAILLLRDVKLPNTSLHYTPLTIYRLFSLKM